MNNGGTITMSSKPGRWEMKGKARLNKETIIEAENEVKRFLQRLKELKETEEYKAESSRYSISGCTESGAVRRASMDLTRALAKLRKS
jgi:hypothetical protein